jgi:hypothetical protein
MCCLSCQWIENRIPSEEALYEERMKQVDWSEPSIYPLFDNCEHLENTATQRECFFNEMSKRLREKLQPDTLHFLQQAYDVDTLWLYVTVETNSKVTFDWETHKIPEARKDTITQLLNEKLKDFPQITPAVKEGIPVKSKFLVPLVIKTEK